jgi:hypothetical protein
MSPRTWTILPGQSAVLADDTGRSLRVGGNDQINVGNDWGKVPIGAVGHLQDRIWYVLEIDALCLEGICRQKLMRFSHLIF